MFPSSVRIKSMRRTPMLAKSYTISEGIVTFEPEAVDIVHRSKKRVKCKITSNFEGVEEQAQLFRSLQETFTSQISLASKDEVPSEADIIALVPYRQPSCKWCVSILSYICFSLLSNRPGNKKTTVLGVQKYFFD
jgi:hypothetical protein